MYVARTYLWERWILHYDVSKLRLELNELRKIRDELRLSSVPELKRGENETTGDRE